MTLAELSDLALRYVTEVLDSPREQAAHVAALAGAALVVAGAFVRTMIPLRWCQVGSNIGFLLFGLLHPSLTTALVAVVLLPINLYRVREMKRLTRRVAASQAASDLSGVWLRPYMKPRKLKAGDILFRRGDIADRLYMLADGRLELVEIRHEIGPGRVFGEIALFSPDHRRTATARCIEDCTVLTIDETTVRELYFQNPSFGFHLIGLVAARLSLDVERIAHARTGTEPLFKPEPGEPEAKQPHARGLRNGPPGATGTRRNAQPAAGNGNPTGRFDITQAHISVGVLDADRHRMVVAAGIEILQFDGVAALVKNELEGGAVVIGEFIDATPLHDELPAADHTNGLIVDRCARLNRHPVHVKNGDLVRHTVARSERHAITAHSIRIAERNKAVGRNVGCTETAAIETEIETQTDDVAGGTIVIQGQHRSARGTDIPEIVGDASTRIAKGIGPRKGGSLGEVCTRKGSEQAGEQFLHDGLPLLSTRLISQETSQQKSLFPTST